MSLCEEEAVFVDKNEERLHLPSSSRRIGGDKVLGSQERPKKVFCWHHFGPDMDLESHNLWVFGRQGGGSPGES